MNTDNTETVKAIMARYERDMELSNRIVVAVKEDAGERLRHLLKPILNRWGMGMRKGGALLYLNPNTEGPDVVEMDKGCDYVLGALHDELAGALWEEVDGGGTLHDYIEDIDIPQTDGEDGGVHYLWLVHWGGVWLEPHSFNDPRSLRPPASERLTLDAEDTNGYSTRTKFYGPVTQEFINDTGIGTIGHDPHPYLDVLPMYTLLPVGGSPITLNVDDTWVRGTPGE
jgi:hypothetical protein